MNRLGQLFEVLRRRGPGYGIYLVVGYFWPRLRHRFSSRLSRRRIEALEALGWAVGGSVFGFAVGLTGGLLGGPRAPWVAALLGLLAAGIPYLKRASRQRSYLAAARRHLAEGGNEGLAAQLPGWSQWPVNAEVRAAVEAQRDGAQHDGSKELVLGRIDADGRLLSSFGEFPGFDAVDEETFLPRTRYDLDLVLAGDRLAVRKEYRGDRQAFLREWLVLSHLAGAAEVPAVLAVDEGACRLSRSFLPGDTVNDLLVRSGAVLRLAQTAEDPELAQLEGKARLDAVLARGTARLSQVVSQEFLARLETLVDRIHARGVTGLSLTFGNVMVTPTQGSDGIPWLFDFDGSLIHPSTKSFAFELERDRDRRKLHQIYGLEGITRGNAAAALARAVPSAYSPVDLGGGLATRGFWSVDSGSGRWEYLNGKALRGHIEGRRILDLGCHNGILPLCMLQAGAREVVAVEYSPEAARAAQELQRLFEWRDLRPYALSVHCSDMLSILDRDLGTFDVVTAFCSLYYLEAEEMEQIVRRAAELAPVLVLQAKSDTRSQAADNKALKSSPEFLERLLRLGGFSEIERVAPQGYSRPLLIGHKPDAAPLTSRNPPVASA